MGQGAAQAEKQEAGRDSRAGKRGREALKGQGEGRSLAEGPWDRGQEDRGAFQKWRRACPRSRCRCTLNNRFKSELQPEPPSFLGPMPTAPSPTQKYQKDLQPATPHTFSHSPVAPEHALSTQRRPRSPSSLMEFGGQDPRRWSVQDSRRETAATFAQGARPNGKWLLPWQAGGLSRTYAPPTSPLPTSYAGSSGGTGQTRRCWPPQPGFSPNPRSRLEP